MADAIPIRAGSRWGCPATFKDAAGAPIPLTGGRTVSARILWGSTTLSVSVAVTDAAAGKARLSLTGAQTATIPKGRVSRLVIDLLAANGEPELGDEVDVEGR